MPKPPERLAALIMVSPPVLELPIPVLLPMPIPLPPDIPLLPNELPPMPDPPPPPPPSMAPLNPCACAKRPSADRPTTATATNRIERFRMTLAPVLRGSASGSWSAAFGSNSRCDELYPIITGSVGLQTEFGNFCRCGGCQARKSLVPRLFLSAKSARPVDSGCLQPAINRRPGPMSPTGRFVA